MMGNANALWAELLHEIAEQISLWDQRDVQEQLSQGESFIRTNYHLRLRELAAALEGRSTRYSASVTARQNWLRSVEDFDRDLEIAMVIHKHRLDPNSTVKAGKEQAKQIPGATEAIIDSADKRFRRALKDNMPEIWYQLRRAEVAGHKIVTVPAKGENQT